MRRGYLAILLVAIGLCALLTVPMEAENKEHQQMMADLRILQQQVQSLQGNLSTLADAVGKVSAKLDVQNDLNRKAFADVKLAGDSVASETRIIRERIDESNTRLQSLSQEIDVLRVRHTEAASTAGNATSAEQAQSGLVSPTQTQSSQARTGDAGGPINPGTSLQRLFDAALADYYAAQWDLAIQGFETFMKAAPKGERSGEAQFYIGEAYFLSQRYREAVVAYNSLIARFPANKILPDAYYKRGAAFQALGELQSARESYELAVKNYPDSAAGILASQAITKLAAVRK